MTFLRFLDDSIFFYSGREELFVDLNRIIIFFSLLFISRSLGTNVLLPMLIVRLLLFDGLN